MNKLQSLYFLGLCHTHMTIHYLENPVMHKHIKLETQEFVSWADSMVSTSFIYLLSTQHSLASRSNANAWRICCLQTGYLLTHKPRWTMNWHHQLALHLLLSLLCQKPSRFSVDATVSIRLLSTVFSAWDLRWETSLQVCQQSLQQQMGSPFSPGLVFAMHTASISKRIARCKSFFVTRCKYCRQIMFR